MPRPTNQAVSIYGNPLDLADEAPNLDTPLTVVRAATYVSSLTTLFTGAGGNGMKASPGTVLVVDTTPAKEAFGCNAITRTPD